MKAESRKQKAETVAALLDYPPMDSGEWCPRTSALHITEDVAAFLTEVRNVEADGLEELYTRTFDLNPVATLDLGWHLYGERYERGRLLALLRELEDAAGIDSDGQLPDHLPVVLRLIAESNIDGGLRQQLAVAVGRIKATLDHQGNPYRHLIRAAEELIV